jgi:hypothetical protein
MKTTNIVDFTRRDGMLDALTELLKTGAQQLIATAVEAEFVSYLAQFAGLRTEEGHAAVVRNGHHPARPLLDGHWPCERTDSQSSIQRRHSSDISFGASSTLRAQNQDAGSCLAMALP